MSQPWIITIDDATEPEPTITLKGSPVDDDIELNWYDFRELIAQGTRIVEMIDGKSLDAMSKAAKESVT